LSVLYAYLVDWSGTSTVLLSSFEFGLGFICALAFMQLCFHVYVALIRRESSQLSGFHLSLLFACATWNFFMSMLTMRVGQYPFFDEVNVIVIAWVTIAPFSIIAGIPAFLVYAIRRPVIGPWPVYLCAGAISVTSYLYLNWLEQAFRNSS
jgi:hypothetical protein